MPENHHIQLQLATAYAKLAVSGEHDLIRPAFDRINRALTLKPTFLEAVALRAKFHRFQGDYADAVKDWRSVASENPDLVHNAVMSFLNRHKAILAEARLEREGGSIRYVPLAIVRAPAPEIWGIKTETLLSAIPVALVFLAAGVGRITNEEGEMTDTVVWTFVAILAIAALSGVWLTWRHVSRQNVSRQTLSESQPSLFMDLLKGTASIDQAIYYAKYVADSLEYERAERQRAAKRAAEEEAERLRKRDELLAQSLKAAKKSGCGSMVILFVVLMNTLVAYIWLL